MGSLHNPSGEIQIFNLNGVRRPVYIFGSFIVLSVFGLLWINFLYNPWPWSWNPLYWLIFLRTGGPLLYANHVSSVVAVLSVASYFAIKNPKNAAQWILVVLSTGSCHEMIGITETVLATSTVALQPITHLYWIDLGFVLALALIVSTRKQKRMMAEIALVCAVFNAAWLGVILGLHVPTLTVKGFVPGPQFFDWRENSLEVASWTVPSAWWLRWRRQP